MKEVPTNMKAIFARLKGRNRSTFKFLNKFVDEYIEGYWLKRWEPSEICYWGDLSKESCEDMNNNALESYNDELLTLLGRKSHPNPYHFASTVKTALAHTSQKIAWVEQGTFEKARSRKTEKAIGKRHRLKLLYQNRLDESKTDEDKNRAMIRYMIGTGATNSRILAKGRKRAMKMKSKNPDVHRGRPKYKREKALIRKKCRFCGRSFASPNGAKNHEKFCQSRKGCDGTLSCQYCGKLYSQKFWLEAHKKTCKKRSVREKDEVDKKRTKDDNSFLDESTSNSEASQRDSTESSITTNSESSLSSITSKDNSIGNETQDENDESFSFERELSILKHMKSDDEVVSSLERLQEARLCMEMIVNSSLDERVKALSKFPGAIGRQARILDIFLRKIVKQTLSSNQILGEVLEETENCSSNEIVINQVSRIETIQPSIEFLLTTKAATRLRALPRVNAQVGLRIQIICYFEQI